MLHSLNGPSQTPSVRFAWCPIFCEIEDNERVDSEAKTAASNGLLFNNKVDYKQLISFLSADYLSLDFLFLNSLNRNAGNFLYGKFQ